MVCDSSCPSAPHVTVCWVFVGTQRLLDYLSKNLETEQGRAAAARQTGECIWHRLLRFAQFLRETLGLCAHESLERGDWVCCDICDRWRLLPGSVAAKLPCWWSCEQGKVSTFVSPLFLRRVAGQLLLRASRRTTSPALLQPAE